MEIDNRALHITTASIVANIGFALIKIVTGVAGNSYALIADGIESIADIVSSFIVWSGIRISTTPPDDKHPYGHGKAESLAGFLAALALGFSGVFIAWNSVHEILAPQSTPEWFTLPIILAIILVKSILWRWMSQAGRALNSTAIINDGWHHLSDLITSAAVMIGLIITLMGGDAYARADDIAALVVCVFIFYNAYKLIQSPLDEIMDATVSEKNIEAVRKCALSVPKVAGIDKIRIRKSGLGYLVDIDVEVNGKLTVHEGHTIAHAVKNRLLEDPELKVSNALVHIEPTRE